MSWRETEPMNEKIKFISAYLNNEFTTFHSLCQRFTISTKTGYKLLNRYKAEGIDGLKERSRAPQHHANKLSVWIEQTILELKYRYPRWGAKKVLSYLKQEKSQYIWPARSTIDELFKRHQLVISRKRKKQVVSYTEPFVLCEQPNDIWSIDYKGQFRLGNKTYCYPLTVTDNYSRYILAIDGFKRISREATQQTLDKLFSKFGLPLAIRSDNGVPFAGFGLGGLSRLSVWFIKLGIIPERIRKGHPQENGRHERMHFTLKQETASPPRYNQNQQQRRFNQFIKVFNEERPHEGIHFDRPAWLYTSSERAYSKKGHPIDYDTQFCTTRLVRSNGTIKWKGQEIFLTELLAGEHIALKPHAQDEWMIYFSFFPLGIFNEKMKKVNKQCD